MLDNKVDTPIDLERAAHLPRALSYHRELASILKEHEDGIWDWFASDKMTTSANDDARLFLLKNAVRLDHQTHSDIYEKACGIAEQLGIKVPIVLYQSSGTGGRNAAIIPMPSETAILFEGDILNFLSDAEQTAVLAHEMGHFLHQHVEDGELLLADRMLDWICNEGGAHNAHLHSLWRSRLYQEIYADRIALHVCGDRDVVISMLLKMVAGIDKVSVKAYLEQANEALNMNDSGGAEGSTHPESYIRAIAVDRFAENPDFEDDALSQLVEGNDRIERLDIVGQRRVSKQTRQLIDMIFEKVPQCSESLEAHARAFFPDYGEKTKQILVEKASISASDYTYSTASQSFKSYLSYVLLDFSTLDPDLEDLVLMAAFDISSELGIADVFDEKVEKELKMKMAKIVSIRAGRDTTKL